MKIRIETRQGKIITRNACTADYIGRDGRMWSVAQVGIHLYKVSRRDAEGPVYKVY